MKPGWKILLATITGVILIWGYKVYKLTSSLSYSISDFSWNNSLSNPEISLSLKIFNPSDRSASFSNLRGNLYYKTGTINEPVFFVSDSSKTDITENSSLVVPLKLTAVPSAVNSGIIGDAILNYSNNIFFRGWIDVDNIPLPLNFNVA